MMVSTARSISPLRSRSRLLSGPANSTRISGCSRFSPPGGMGGFTVIRYFSLNPPALIIMFRSDSIFLATATLSCSIFRIQIADCVFFQRLAFAHCPLLHGLAYLLPEFRPVDYELLYPCQQVADRPVDSKSGRKPPTDQSQHERHHDLYHLLLRRLHSSGGHALLADVHRDHDSDGQDVQWIGAGKIMDPEPVRLSQVNGVSQHRIKRI